MHSTFFLLHIPFALPLPFLFGGGSIKVIQMKSVDGKKKNANKIKQLYILEKKRGSRYNHYYHHDSHPLAEIR